MNEQLHVFEIQRQERVYWCVAVWVKMLNKSALLNIILLSQIVMMMMMMMMMIIIIIICRFVNFYIRYRWLREMKAWNCGRTPPGIRTDHRSRGVILSVMCLSVIEGPHRRNLVPLGLSSCEKTNRNTHKAWFEIMFVRKYVVI